MKLYEGDGSDFGVDYGTDWVLPLPFGDSRTSRSGRFRNSAVKRQNMPQLSICYDGGCSGAVHGSSPVSGTEVWDTIVRAQEFFFAHQQEDGHWCVELEGDALLQGEMIILLTYLGEENSPLAHKLATKLVHTQSRTGGWPMYYGGADSLNNTVKAYFALKITGHDPSAEYMQRARQAVIRMGGADKINSFTRFYLALLEQIPFECCPAVPPEMILLPLWFPINLYAVSSWTRTIIVPLSMVSALRPSRKIPQSMGIRELFVSEPENWPPLSAPKVTRLGQKEQPQPGFFSWENFFRCADVALKKYQKYFGKSGLRRRALDKMENWLWDHCQNSDGPGAIQPPIIWGLVAMKARGYDDNHEKVRYFREQLDRLLVEDSPCIDPKTGKQQAMTHMQPCRSPVWDTLLTLRALAAGGIRASETCRPEFLKHVPQARKAVEWLLAQQHTTEGDWAVTVNTSSAKRQGKAIQPGAWAFEYNNAFYPDCDDSAMALMALHELFACGLDENSQANSSVSNETSTTDFQLLAQKRITSVSQAKEELALLDRVESAIRRCVAWLEGMQNKDGGWASFDKGNTRQFLCHVPFADHNAMIDPSTTDITGRILEAFGALGRRTGEKIIDRAVAFIRSNQLADGSWFGRWGVNYIYGTGEALNGLAAVGVPRSDTMVERGAQWLITHQQSDGGWGETADSYQDPQLRGTGDTTPSQTAWALLGLIANGYERHPAVVRGIKYLIDRQDPDGQWPQPQFTGTGFPLVFYLNYHWYRNYFPLKAVSDWTAKLTQAEIAGLFCKYCTDSTEDDTGEEPDKSFDSKSERNTDLVNELAYSSV